MAKLVRFNNLRQYLLLTIVIAGTALGGYKFFRHIKNELTVVTVNTPYAESTQPPTTTALTVPEPIAKPKRLLIAAIGVDATVQNVGLTNGGNMAAPTNGTDVAWYKAGTSPGELGNAVMAGHLDDGGKPAIFWNLNKLQTGDLVEVIDANMHTSRFKVTNTQRFDINSAPLKEIFGSSNKAQLNLITCDGAWDKNQRIYSQRLVVFTKAV